MRRLVQRLAWLVARVGVILALCFAVLSTATRSNESNWRSTRLENAELPLFFNATPLDLRLQVHRQLLALKTADSPGACAKLDRLGAAVFPVVLAELSTLAPSAQSRVARALLPIAFRMGGRNGRKPTDPVDAVGLVQSLWYERAADFQPNLVARWVDRLARRDNAGLRATVLEYDTYALSALIASMNGMLDTHDIEALYRLSEVASQITGQPWTLPLASNSAKAKAIVDQWNRWWLFHRNDYVALSGPTRWSAMLTETLFGKWLSLSISPELGRTKDDHEIRSLVIPAGWRTLLLLLCATLGPWLVTFIPIYRLEKVRPTWARLVLARGGLSLSTIPLVSLVSAVSGIKPLQHSLFTAAAAVALTTAVGTLGSACNDTFRTSSARSGQSGSSGVVRDRRGRSALLRLLRQWHFAGHYWPFSLLLAFFAERAFQIDGLAQLSVGFFHQHDLSGLMAITTFSATSLLVVEFVVQHGRRYRDSVAMPEGSRP